MRRFYLFISLFLSCLLCQAQDLERNKEIALEISKNSNNYSFASAFGKSFDEALEAAVTMLGSQIITDVKSQSSIKVHSANQDGRLTEEITYEQVSKTFSNVKLSDYHILVTQMPNKKNKDYAVFVYISKDRIDNLIKEIEEKEAEESAKRQQNINRNMEFYYEESEKAIEDLRIGDALKDLYWCYALSVISPNTTLDINGQEKPASSLSESKINTILDNILISITDYTQVKVNEFQDIYSAQLHFQYKNNDKIEDITNLDYLFNNGNTFIKGPRVRDGIGLAELSYDLEKIEIHCIYKYDKNETPSEISELIGDLDTKTFESAMKTIYITKKDKEELGKKKTTASEGDNLSIISDDEASVSDTIRNYDALRGIMRVVETAIRNKDYVSIQSYFTDNGYDCFKKLIQYGNATIIGETNYDFLEFKGRTLCRSIPMCFRFRNNKQFIENVIFRFDRNDKIESLAFALSEVTQNDILKNGNWKRDSRLTLLSFMEDYQTAYALGRIEYLEKIFSENALIIVGTDVQEKVLADDIKLQGYTKYQKMTKSEYIDRLRAHFRTKEYINLNFTETDFDQASNGIEFYGIRVRQEYFSNTYGDIGYLFLLVDLRGEDPIIHIRAWQKDKTPVKELFGLGNTY